MKILYNKNEYHYVNEHPKYFSENSNYSLCVCCNLAGLIGDNIDCFIHYIPNIDLWENIYFCINCKANLLINILDEKDFLKLEQICELSNNLENLTNNVIKYNEYNSLSHVFTDINIVDIILDYLPKLKISEKKKIGINPYNYLFNSNKKK